MARALGVADGALLGVNLFLVRVEVSGRIAEKRHVPRRFRRALRLVDVDQVLADAVAVAIQLRERAVDRQAAHALRLRDSRLLDDAPAHGDAVEVRSFDAERVHEADRVLGEELRRIRHVRAVRAPGAAVIEADHLEVLAQPLDLPRPGARIAGEPADMDERRALAVELVTHVDVPDADSWHCSPSFWVTSARRFLR